MSARTLTTTAAVVALLAVSAPAKAADLELVNLLPADAKVIAGVNVSQAKGSPFGQYVLSQMKLDNHGLQQITLETGFDPTNDVHELLAAGSGDATAKKGNGLVIARGNFNIAGITAAATGHEALSQTYRGVNILTDPKSEGGVAFLNPTLVVAGDLASVKAAIDRRSSPAALPASLISQINQWSTSTDAWVITTVPPASLALPKGAPNVPGVGQQNANALQNIRRAAAGVQFGSQITVKSEALADNPQDAQQMADGLKLLASIAQMQGNGDAAVAALVQNLNIGSQGNLLNVSVSLPSDQLQKLIAPAHKAAGPRKVERK